MASTDVGLVAVPATTRAGPMERPVQLSSWESGAVYANVVAASSEILEALQQLDVRIAQVVQAAEKNSGKARGSEVRADFDRLRELLDLHAPRIRDAFEEISRLFNLDWNLRMGQGDRVARMLNSWLLADLAWKHAAAVGRATNSSADDIVRAAGKVREPIQHAIDEAILLTIPWRVRDALDAMRVGQTMDFEAAFRDVLTPEQITRVIKYLRDAPLNLENGIVLPDGKVRRVAQTAYRRRLSFLVLTIPLFALGALMLAMNLVVPTEPAKQRELATAMILVFAGAAAHLVVDGLKQWRSTKEADMPFLSDWGLWVHANESKLLVGMVTILVGFAGLAYFTDALAAGTKIDSLTAFVTGYSVDTFVDLFLQRFTTGVTEASAALKTRFEAATTAKA